MLRILHVLGRLGRGGAETFIMNLYRSMDRSRVQFDFIVHSSEKTDYYNEIIDLGGKIFVFPKPSIQNLRKICLYWNSFLENHKEYMIIHTHIRSYASLIAQVVKRKNRVFIMHSHSISNGSGIKAFLKNIMQFPVRYMADYCFACSDEAGKWLFGQSVASKKNYYVIKNGINVDDFIYNKDVRNNYRRDLGLEGYKIFINVANFRKVKNHKFLIDLMQRIVKKTQNVRLLLVGAGEGKDEVIKQVKDKHLQNFVLFLGERSDVAGLLQAADCFLFPSLWEGLGISAIEAQTAGLRTICSDKVPIDVKISDLCQIVPLDLDKWEEIIADVSLNYDRRNMTTIIREAGYDINSISQWLLHFYEGLSRNG